MSSTLVVGTPTSVVSSVSSDAPSLPSLPSPSSGVNTVSLFTLATSPTPTTSPPITAFSKQSQQPSSVIQSTMSATTVTITTVPSSASPSAPSSTVSLTLARTSSMLSSTRSATIASSSTESRSTTTAPTSQSPTLTSSPLTTATLGMTTSSTSVTTSTSNTPFTATLPSSSSSPGSSPEGASVPLTTVLESTTVFITSTNSQGQVMTSIPPVVTEVITTTGSGGIVTTITQAVVNPTLAPNNSTAGDSSFLTNTGAVVGVFVVVGLACASILLWILFALRHRQRMKRIEQDTAVEAVVAAAGLNRAPLDDDDEDDSPTSPSTRRHFSSEMGQRSSFLGLGGSGSLQTSAQLLDDTMKDSTNSHLGPAGHRTNNNLRGYVPTRTTSPSPRTEPFTDDLGSSRDRKSSYGHTPTYSAGSFEPLLANYVQTAPDQDTSAVTMQLQRNRSSQHPGSCLVLNGYSTDGSPENRSRASSQRQNSLDSSVLRDEEDYTRYVLMVRNVPDDQSQHSL